MFTYILFMIVSILIPIIVISIIILIIAGRKKEKSHNAFKRSMKIVFAYICLITSLLAMVIGIVTTVKAILDYTMPDTVVSIETNIDKKQVFKIDDETYMTDVQAGLQIQNEKNDAMVKIISALATIFVSMPIFIYFRTIVKKEKNKDS